MSEVFQRWLNAWPHSLPAWLASQTLGGELAAKGTRTAGGQQPIISRADLSGLAAAWISEQSVVSRTLDNLPIYEARKLPRDIGTFRHSMRTVSHSLDHTLEAALEMATCLNLSPAIRVQIFVNLSEFATATSRQEPLQSRASAIRNSVSDDLWKQAFRAEQLPDALPGPWFRGVELHVCSEALWPSLRQCHPVLGMQGWNGEISGLHLIGPLHVETSVPTNLAPWLENYDLMFPFTAFALPKLRKLEPEWMLDRAWRNVFMLPLLLGDEPAAWRSLPPTPLSFSRLMLFMPNPNHYDWLFAEHSQDEWGHGSASALWDLETGQVFYADGIHTEESLRAEGKQLSEWLGLRE